MTNVIMTTGIRLRNWRRHYYLICNTFLPHQIKNLTLEDADVYKCIASNTHGEATFSISLIVTESESNHFI